MSDLPPIRVSYTQLTTYRTCPLKFHWHYRKGYRVTEKDPKLALGSAWHECVLEPHYQTIKDYQDTSADGRSPARGTPEEDYLLTQATARVHAALDAALRGETYSGLKPDDYDTLKWMYDGYKAHWGCDPQWRILDLEYTGLAPMGTITTPDGLREVILDYRIDLVVQDLELGGIFIVESKSTSQLSSRFAMELDDQTGLYEWAFRTSDHPMAGAVNGSIRSEAKKTMNAGDKPGATRGKPQTLQQRHQRLKVPRTDIELNALRMDALATAQAAFGGTVPVYSGPNPAQCGWMCQFKEVHIEARKGHPVSRLMQDHGFTQVPTAFNNLAE